MKKQNKHKILLTLLLACVFVAGATPIPAKAASDADYDSYCRDFVEAYNVPGMAVSITKADEVIFSGTYGTCTSSEDLFFIGSESKSFTALAIMQLAEAGKIDLDADVTTYLPELKLAKPVTIKMLLNQVSGFTQFMRPFEREVTKGYGKYSYSNANYETLGEVVVRVSGETYADYMREHIFEPLGMDNTFASTKEAVKHGLVGGHRNFFGFNVKGNGVTPKENSWFHEPAGYIASTSSDMTKYMQMYLRMGVSADGTRIISEDSMRKMVTETAPFRDGTAGYGFGLIITHYRGNLYLFHDGLTEEYRTYFLISPYENIAFSVLINGEDYLAGNNLTQNICNDLLFMGYGEKPAKLRRGAYLTKRITLDIEYAAAVAIAIFYLVRMIGSKKKLVAEGKKMPLKKKLISSAVVLLLAGGCLFLTPLLGRTPLWVIMSYVPDLFAVLVISAVISIAGSIYCFLPEKKR